MAQILSLHRYPVKAMAGEQLQDAEITPRGLLGDRAYALVDSRNRVGTAKKRAGLLQFQARFLTPPQTGEAVPPVGITLPNGAAISSEQSDVAEIISAALGHAVTLLSSAPPGLILEFAAGTLAGKHAETTECPIAGASPAGTFFDYAVIHLLTTSSLARLRAAYPQGLFDLPRFRPNVVVETEDQGFVENSWVGRTLALGDEVRLRVSIPCPRCVTPTLPQPGLPHDPGILRTVARENSQDLGDFGTLPCVGVYADVVQPGFVRRGDTVRVLD